MEQIVLKDKKGLTLIEVMVALVVLLIVFLGMMQAIAIGVNLNVKNTLRDEGVKIANERMNALKNTSFSDAILNDTATVYVADDVDPDTVGVQSTVTRSFRNFDVVFTANRRVEDINPPSATNKRVNIRISWAWKAESYTHEIERVIVQE
ncbi:MAG: prepilin-type N-terminal cleavage/methylation domain-containing protein [Nitrospirae bacterium]|nr:prepilin-type N-terminal cleavage/methylation domain-containing protein [Nitrospirota bacterium]